MESKELDDIFDDIRQTCGDCEHPRCLSIIKSAKAAVTAEVERARIHQCINLSIGLRAGIYDGGLEVTASSLTKDIKRYEAELDRLQSQLQKVQGDAQI